MAEIDDIAEKLGLNASDPAVAADLQTLLREGKVSESSEQPPPPQVPAGGKPSVPEGWYLDPNNPGQQRYWDGEHWSEQVVPQIPPPAVGQQVAQVARKSSKATWSLVMGIMGILVLPIVFSILAIVMGISAQSEIDRDPAITGRGNATAGVVLGIIGLVLWAVILIVATNGG